MAVFLQNTEAIESALDGCPDLTAGRAIIIPAGGNLPGSPAQPASPAFSSAFSCSFASKAAAELGAIVCHQLRDNAGGVIDLTPLDPSTWEVACRLSNGIESVVLMANAMCPHDNLYTANVVFKDAVNGRICWGVPDAISNCPGIYNVNIVLADSAGNPYLSDDTLLSVEPSLLGRLHGASNTGPITLGAVRMQLRDFPGLNIAWDNAEFSDAEIVHSLLQPIMAFNETLPRGKTFTAMNFPFHHQWLEAATANLLRMAANWYLRNHREIKYGDGKTESDLNKARDYMQLAELKWNRYLQFCREQKVTYNWSGGFSSFGGAL